MDISSFNDTICAPATGSGGAIAIIRVSGPGCFAAVDTVVRFRAGTASSSEGYRIKFGEIPDVDEVLVSIFRAPHSYTGEDSAEICCHASPFIVSRIMQLLADSGCRAAGPGEFTRRAFINGKMDLAQAEAVADVIAADSAAAHRIASNQLRGQYSEELRSLRDRLVEIASLMELELDFSEEEVEFADRAKLNSLLDVARTEITRLADSFKAGNAIKNGVPVVIAGAANAGKSTLLNALLGEERAIVSDIPGTTRDTVEETLVLDGIRFRFIDTAGLRESSDAVERIGIERSHASMAKAQVVIGVLDGLSPLEELRKACKEITSHLSPAQTLLLVRSKVDAYDAIPQEEFPRFDRSYGILELKYPAFGTYNLSPEELTAELAESLAGYVTSGGVLDISARTGEGLEALKKRLVESVGDLPDAASATLVTNLRHYEALVSARDSLSRVSDGLRSGIANEFLTQDLRSATQSLSSIFGEVTTDDILGRIFERFCIGK
ncbi:MAG: tRNA uridine-5-carboxymethylaminomethyl(34) synthesis GTPase MnmE [Bacteroidales bacterium]|nr:tRNA uridine-5-carboxymethylaminomethyl(34) synthesis GTPase MnmE [Bacteroidales bacterium]